jgi:hypothetical protein
MRLTSVGLDVVLVVSIAATVVADPKCFQSTQRTRRRYTVNTALRANEPQDGRGQPERNKGESRQTTPTSFQNLIQQSKVYTGRNRKALTLLLALPYKAVRPRKAKGCQHQLHCCSDSAGTLTRVTTQIANRKVAVSAAPRACRSP